MAELVAFAKRELYYPESAINDHIEGNVILQYKIDKDGNVADKGIFKSLRNDLDTVCLKMLDKMPSWKPAKLSDISVETYSKWTITFVLRLY
jgi:TonB family protein